MKRYWVLPAVLLIVFVAVSGRFSAKASDFPQIAPEAVLYSDTWHGARLIEATELLGFSLSPSQLDYLDQQSVLRGANTRVLLTLVALNPSVGVADAGIWSRWVDNQITSLRSGLGPFNGESPSLKLQDDHEIYFDPNHTALGTWSLLQTLNANESPAESAADLSHFVQRYEAAFGPVEIEHTAEDVTPFLIHPFSVPLKGRVHFDHRYPTIDNASITNDDPQMIDYLGRVNQVPYNSHDGDDFWLPVNSHIIAPVSGIITWKDSQGVLIKIDSLPGYVVYIGHLSRVDVEYNQEVVRGETQLGLSGIANNIPHIHLEVRHYGQQTDTMGWFGYGSDPCPGLPSQGSYGGCESASWLWLDEEPPETMTKPVTLFSDTFSDGDFSGWAIVDAPNATLAPSTWAVVEAKGSLVLQQKSNIHTPSTPYEGTYVYTGEDWWSDYYFTVETEPDDNDGIFVLFRYQDEDNYYRFFMDRELHYRRLEKKVNGTYTTLAEDLEEGFDADWNIIQIDLTSNNINVSLEYEQVLSVNDSTFSQGKIGLGTWACQGCYFDNVVVSTHLVDPFADSVVGANIKDMGNEHKDPRQALGRPNATKNQDFVSVGGPTYWFSVDMGEGEEIVDGPGHDFRICEVGAVLGGEDEEYRVFASNNIADPWTYVGEGWTTSEFDLKGTGLRSAQYIHIEDLSVRTSDPVNGSDIDAIQAMNMEGAILPPPPENVTISDSASGVTIAWDPVDRAVAYNVYYGRTGAAAGYSVIATVAATKTNYAYSGDKPKELFFRVTSIGPEGYESRFSLAVPFQLFLPLLSSNN